jgi:hypothetical protein
MHITLMDRSLYFKGLMLLIRKDGQVAEAERGLMTWLGRVFSYEKRFCQEVIDDILTNRYVVDEPPVFTDPAIARCFLQDGARLSRVDGKVHSREQEWLLAVGRANGLDRDWCESVLQAPAEPAFVPGITRLEAEAFTW